MKRIAVLFSLVIFTLGACQMNRESAGTLIGGVGGAAIGSQIGSGSGQLIATAVGTMLGAMLGRDIGRQLDEVDRARWARAQHQAYGAPVGSRISWNNQRSGNHGTVTPVREGYARGSGAYCREFQHTVTIGGQQEQAYGTACQRPDGDWQVVAD